MSKKDLFKMASIAFALVFAVLSYLSIINDYETITVVSKNLNITEYDRQPFTSWQKITTTIIEGSEKMAINIKKPEIITPYSNVDSEVDKTIEWYIDLYRNDFISMVDMVAEDNGETNTLDIVTEVLVLTPRLLSLAFIKEEFFAGSQSSSSERTYLVFDLEKEEWLKESNVFHDNLAWGDASVAIKSSLFSDYHIEGGPNCDLLFAPKKDGFAASCIGVDFDQGGKHISVTGDIPLSAVQEFVAPSFLSDISN